MNYLYGFFLWLKCLGLLITSFDLTCVCEDNCVDLFLDLPFSELIITLNPSARTSNLINSWLCQILSRGPIADSRLLMILLNLSQSIYLHNFNWEKCIEMKHLISSTAWRQKKRQWYISPQLRLAETSHVLEKSHDELKTKLTWRETSSPCKAVHSFNWWHNELCIQTKGPYFFKRNLKTDK